MAMLQNHSAQFGAYMNQHRMSQEAMLHLLFERIKANSPEPELNITILAALTHLSPLALGGAIRMRRIRVKQKPYEKGIEAVAESGKPPPPPPPAPEAVLLGNAPRHMAAIADAPQQIQAPRGRSRSRTKATAGAGREPRKPWTSLVQRCSGWTLRRRRRS